MHSAENRSIARRMLSGGSGGRRPESLWKKTNQGNFRPAYTKVAADAAASSNHTAYRCPSAAACESMDLLTNPEVSGKEEIESAPTIPQAAVNGMLRTRPPRSVHLRLPVMYSTEPADMR